MLAPLIFKPKPVSPKHIKQMSWSDKTFLRLFLFMAIFTAPVINAYLPHSPCGWLMQYKRETESLPLLKVAPR